MENIALIAGLVALVYFMQIRPQQKTRKAHEDMLKGLIKGNHIIALGGLHGIVFSLTDDMVTIEIASGVYVQINRGCIDRVVGEDGEDANKNAEIEETQPEDEDTNTDRGGK